jgi:hypothetical protein
MASVVGDPYSGVYPEALAAFMEFRQATSLALEAVSEQAFRDGMRVMSADGKRPSPSGRDRLEFLIRRLLGHEPEIDVLIALKDWLQSRAGN